MIGGAYSIDKHYRLAMGYGWWPDEQPSPQVKEKVERVLEERNWQVDVVFSHTCPLKYEPVEVFLPGVDQSTVDKSTEEWLDAIESKLHYERWYCGHYHTEKQVDKLRFMFEDYAVLPGTPGRDAGGFGVERGRRIGQGKEARPCPAVTGSIFSPPRPS